MRESQDAAQRYYEESKSYKNTKKEIHPLAMFSFGIGILPFFIWWIFVLPVAGIFMGMLAIPIFLIGVVLGIIAMMKISKSPKKFKGEGFALLGIALNTFYILLLIVIFVVFVFSFV